MDNKFKALAVTALSVTVGLIAVVCDLRLLVPYMVGSHNDFLLYLSPVVGVFILLVVGWCGLKVNRIVRKLLQES